VINPDVKAMLIRQGFTPKVIQVPAELGGGTTEALSKVFPVR
jgi:hypothetical protein